MAENKKKRSAQLMLNDGIFEMHRSKVGHTIVAKKAAVQDLTEKKHFADHYARNAYKTCPNKIYAKVAEEVCQGLDQKIHDEKINIKVLQSIRDLKPGFDALLAIAKEEDISINGLEKGDDGLWKINRVEYIGSSSTNTEYMEYDPDLSDDEEGNEGGDDGDEEEGDDDEEDAE